MASAIVTPRLLHKEDLSLSTDHTPATSNQEVLGLGTTPLTPINALMLSDLVAAADDTAAGVGGVAVGYIYFNTGTNKVKTRMS